MSELFSYIPEPARSVVRAAWRQVPPDLRGDLQAWLPYALRDAGSARDLFGFITDNYRVAFDRSRIRVAIVGPANAGKSTLYNQFVRNEGDRAVVGAEPGTTRENRESTGNLFILVDTPGADAVGAVGAPEREKALAAARDAAVLIVVFDAQAGISQPDRAMFDAFKALRVPYVVTLNKMDLVAKRDRDRVLDAAAEALGMDRAEIIEIGAKEGTNLGRVVLAVAQTDYRLLTTIGESLPEYRAKLAWQRIVTAASASASVALIPLPLADIVPLLGIQTGLVLSIARIYGYEITVGRAKELLAAFGVAFLARSVFRQLSKMLGVPGWLLSAAVAGAATVGIGYASVLWFERGERPSQEALEKITRDVSVHLRDRLLALRLKRADGATLREQVRAALEDLPSLLRPASRSHSGAIEIKALPARSEITEESETPELQDDQG
jgi:GTP-binding protein Era